MFKCVMLVNNKYEIELFHKTMPISLSQWAIYSKTTGTYDITYHTNATYAFCKKCGSFIEPHNHECEQKSISIEEINQWIESYRILVDIDNNFKLICI